MIDIKIKNLQDEKPTHPWQIRVDRSSPLGNPFPMKDESQRDAVCDEYKKFFFSVVDSHDDDDHTKRFMEELSYLFDIYESYGQLELFCWCAPKRCHAETIRDFMIRRIEDNLTN